MKKKEINEFIENYKQANHILDSLEEHQFQAQWTLPEKIKKLEVDCIRTALYNNTITGAAAELGISRELLHYKMKKYNIKADKP